MSSNKVDKITGELVTLANGSRMWVGSKAAHDAAVQAGTMPNNCLIALIDDYEDATVDVVEKDNMHPVTSNAVAENIQDIPGLIDNQNVNGAVNMLPNKATSKVINGITFTVNDDGTITVDGTASAWTTFIIVDGNNFPKQSGGTYTLSGCPSGGNYGSYRIRGQFKDSSGDWKFLEDYGRKATNTYADEIYIPSENSVYIEIWSGITFNNAIFKPMLTVASYNGEYVPYAKSNKELTEDVAVKLGGTLTENTTYIDTADLHYEQFGKVTHVFGNFTTKTAIASSDALVQLFSNLPKSSGGMKGTSSAYTLCLIHDNANNYRCFVSKDGELVSRYKEIPIGTYYADFTYISA